LTSRSMRPMTSSRPAWTRRGCRQSIPRQGT
jgi:hypothetical protein